MSCNCKCVNDYEELPMKIKLLDRNATIPSRQTGGSAGFDLYSSQTASVSSGCTFKIRTGIALQIPEGYVGLIFARSGLATKKGLRPANCVGVIDSDYRGEIIVALHNDSSDYADIKIGDRIAQLVIVPYVSPILILSDKLDETIRGSGGFGSTGT